MPKWAELFSPQLLVTKRPCPRFLARSCKARILLLHPGRSNNALFQRRGPGVGDNVRL